MAGVDPVRLKGLTEHALDADGDVWPNASTPSPGRFTVLLALRGAREPGAAHRTVVHAPDREAELDWLSGEGNGPVRPTVTALRPDDPTLRPDEEHESVVLTAVAPPKGDWAADGSAGQLADLMIAAAGAAVPGLHERVLWREIRTPGHVGDETGAFCGGVPAPSLAGKDGYWLHPANSTRLPGLYRVGGWSHPGGGLPHAGMSGALVAGLIVEGPGFRGSQ